MEVRNKGGNERGRRIRQGERQVQEQRTRNKQKVMGLLRGMETKGKEEKYREKSITLGITLISVTTEETPQEESIQTLEV